MNIQLIKFGRVLTSRQAGKEAYAAYSPYLEGISKNETIDIDFRDVIVFSPSWGDEFLTPLLVKFKKRVNFLNTNNPSVRATTELLEAIKWEDIK